MADDLVAVRAAIMDYLHQELLGPREGEQEIVSDPPFDRYSAGTLYPVNTSTSSVTDEEEEDEIGVASGIEPEEQSDDPVVLANQFLPGSMAVSFYLCEEPEILVQVTAARYIAVEEGEASALGTPHKRRARYWKREPITEPASGEFRLISPGPDSKTTDYTILGGAGRLNAVWRKGKGGWLVTVAVINARTTSAKGRPSVDDCLYQVQLRCRPAGEGRIAAYPHTRLLTDDAEEHLLDLLYRRQASYGVGHGCSVAWQDPIDGTTAEIRTEFLPSQEVPPITYDLPGYDRVLNLYFLANGDVQNGEDLVHELDNFVAGYESWYRTLPQQNQDIPVDLSNARDKVLERIERTLERMKSGAHLLKKDKDVRRAFCLANRAMLMQMAHSRQEYAGESHPAKDYSYQEPTFSFESAPRWRPFQLAFQLLTVASVAFPEDPYRSVVDLIWFPTGGGKTEAYLAVTAFLIFFRRMTGSSETSGTAVLMRYTLRLLTTQQFRRAATLICACEVLRRDNPELLGDDKISIGLWVGSETTPNTYQQAYKSYTELLMQDTPKSPFQIDRCPWCGTEMVPARQYENTQLYGIHATNLAFWMFCPCTSCLFHDWLPVEVVDQQLYDQPPTLLLATVDKFAGLPWEERVAEFFGGDNRRPPELIIQDELHLISGPLGTMVGIYETAIDALASRNSKQPKILASTATIRRADEQCQGLYARRVELFPPSGLDATDSYFARYDHTRPGRLYVGVMAPAHTASTAMIRTSAALLQAPDDLGLDGSALDAYWTMVAYHNSLRELGKSMTFAADDIPARIKVIANDQAHLRELSEDNVAELTSNIDAPRLGGMLERLEHHVGEDGEVSFLACTNMLSVGVDVQRLGLMLVNGQPKSTSEYIQATSRVGRGLVPGLVVCLYSPSKPRDRSHYEQFVAYHSALYRHVEPTSVTPFTLPARLRALHAVLVSLIRHTTGLSGRSDAGRFRITLPQVEHIIGFIYERVKQVDPREADATLEQINKVFAEWQTRAEELSQILEYNNGNPVKDVLLRDIGDDHADGWETLRSMRNVDRNCNITVMGARG
jgi:hypothetical protein